MHKKHPTHILLIEDDESLREILAMNLEDEGFVVEQAKDGQRGVAIFDPTRHDLVLTDMNMPGLNGLGVLDAIKSRDKHAVVLMLTAFGGTKNALEAMRQGAFHYVEKPVNTRALVNELKRALTHRHHTRNHTHTQTTPQYRATHMAPETQMIASSPAMNKVLKIVDKIANSDAPIMILGESGVGKELVAHTIHERSARSDGAFVAVNCAAIPPELLESVLFGYEKGAFTGAVERTDGKFIAAHGGTLFLDEIAEMSEPLQSKLLRVLQDGCVERVGSIKPERVNVRILAATHQNLEERIARNLFRKDLYYRLNVVPIKVPPLRQRTEDIPVLMRHFLRQLAPQGSLLTLAPEVDDVFLSHTWPGNIRELRNMIERMILLREDDHISLEDVPETIRKHVHTKDNVVHNLDQKLPFDLPDDGLDLMELERRIIIATMERMNGNQSATARYLHIPRHVLVYRLEKFGIDPARFLDT